MALRGAVVDVDGTLVRGEAPIPGAPEALDALRERGLEVVLVTNNPTRSPASVAAHLRALGFDVDAAEVVTSGTVTRRYLRAHHPDGAVFVVGESGLVEQLDGVALTERPREADVFLASIDREFGYADLVDALRALRSGAAFVGTDPDRTIPGREEALPGSGAILGAVEATTGREPTVVGKPSPHAADAVTDRLGVPPESCVAVGDRPDTDVAMGAAAGMHTALVLTGVTDRGAGSDADAVLDSVADLPDALGSLT